MRNLTTKTFLLAAISAVALTRCQGVDATLGAEIRNVEIKAAAVPAKSVVVAAPADGDLAQLTVTEGTKVAAGQVIAVLRNRALQRDYELAKMRTALAMANLAHSAQPAANPTMASAMSENLLETVVQNKRAKLERYRALRRRHDISEQELEDAENEYAWARRDYLAQSTTAAAPEVNRRALQIEVEKARAEEELARDRVAALRITAPLSGTVTATHGIEGQSVYTRDTLAEITDVSTIEIRGEIAPDLAKYAQPGTPVDVKIYSVPPQQFRAPVDRVIPPQAVGAGASLIVRLPNEQGSIKPNTPAKLTIAF
jgi:HlyD family secretion protein